MFCLRGVDEYVIHLISQKKWFEHVIKPFKLSFNLVFFLSFNNITEEKKRMGGLDIQLAPGTVSCNYLGMNSRMVFSCPGSFR
jgi:hypothetical protein